jgi:2-oxoglutarate dehydrogenase complex dehydrogenase (E1) component-like enzyme
VKSSSASSADRALPHRSACASPTSIRSSAQEKPNIPELDPAFYGLSDADMDTVFNAGTLVGPREMKLRDILQFLKDTYCRTIGVEYMYITDMAQKRWVQERLERSRRRPRTTPSTRSTSSSGSRRPRRWSATCTRATSARSASPGRRRDADRPARPLLQAPARPACRSS